jgi:hypothetical protein
LVHIGKWWQIIDCVDVGKWWEIITCVDVEIFWYWKILENNYRLMLVNDDK